MISVRLVSCIGALACVVGCASAPVNTTQIQSVVGNKQVAILADPGGGVTTSSTPSTTSTTSTTPTTTPATNSALGDPEFLKLLEVELTRCEARADDLDEDSLKSRNVNIAIATLGIVAGSIVVPALAAKEAAKSAIAAWGGVAGASNAAQLTLSKAGASAEAVIAAQKQFSDNLKEVTKDLDKLQTGPSAAAFIYRLRIACTVKSPIQVPKS